MRREATYYTYKDTPAGTMLLTSDGQKITGMHWKVFKRAPQPGPTWIPDESLFSDVSAQLDEYFEGKRQEFDIAYHAQGTPFQMSVWQELGRIAYGAKRSYSDIAVAIGKPQAVRAVGTAVGSNPLCIVVPCHRVLASAGTLGGYAGGLASKVKLLQTEGIGYKAT